VVDRFTKMAYFIPTTEKTSTKELAQLFRNNIWKLHRPQFAARIIKELNQMLGIDTKLSTAFYLQTDGQTKRMNQELE